MSERTNTSPPRREDDEADAGDALVDVAGMDSFPASDPPSFWARDVADPVVSGVEELEATLLDGVDEVAR